MLKSIPMFFYVEFLKVNKSIQILIKLFYFLY